MAQCVFYDLDRLCQGVLHAIYWNPIVHGLVRTPLTKDLSRKNKLIHLLLNTDKINTDSGHFSVIRIRRSQTMFTSFYGHWLSVPWMANCKKNFATDCNSIRAELADKCY